MSIDPLDGRFLDLRPSPPAPLPAGEGRVPAGSSLSASVKRSDAFAGVLFTASAIAHNRWPTSDHRSACGGGTDTTPNPGHRK